jgi:hypothetical protein
VKEPGEREGGGGQEQRAQNVTSREERLAGSARDSTEQND